MEGVGKLGTSQIGALILVPLLNIRCRNITCNQKGPIILRTTECSQRQQDYLWSPPLRSMPWSVGGAKAMKSLNPKGEALQPLVPTCFPDHEPRTPKQPLNSN